MRLLLDTHTLIWTVGDTRRLSRRARSAVEKPRNELFVSSATAWEIATKHRLGRLPEASKLLGRFGEHLTSLSAIEMPVSVAHGLLAGSLDDEHADPFDRMIAAQAIIEGLRVVTNDPRIEAFGAATLW